MTTTPVQADLPEGWTSTTPTERDVEDLVRLLRRHEKQARGWPGADSENVAADVTGRGVRTRTHLLVRDSSGVARAWVSCHDRAAGRVLVGVTVDPDLPETEADVVAAYAFAAAEAFSLEIGRRRGVDDFHMDSGAFQDDARQHRWLEESGFTKVRDWWQMSRPVSPDEAAPEAFPPPREGVVVRRVRRDDHVGMPEEQDLRDIHFVLEESFADHFNSYRETFEEFVGRLREDPGHRWDHWWLATVDGEPAGAVVATTVTGRLDSQGRPQPDGSYIDYIGVHQRARGRGVAKSLLRAVIADAAARGRNRVGLEVDADSPTGAHGLYTSMGWRTAYVTESWHKDVAIPAT
ncbi:GNAT family N-acetyltransferase [Ornithinimicrobium sediminis]|uniref:GNAT family N-acetyltransferase n=1 Tax=Ornithinimicrobium sediminis TaxID=2904603 RepID=UPI001E501557|nr:GNAT family N-acetyltransferase [Ornithinimicrobium sediminis]MCE0485594.1 GNAT family N-acetyltransferase [Ornithinimicrobium sediminis]